MIKLYRYIKWGFVILCTCLCLPLVLLAGYDIFYFQNKLDATLQSIDTAGALTQAYSPSFIKLADKHYGWSLPANVALTLDAGLPGRPNLRSNVKIYLESKLLDFHLTRTEQLKIIANKIYLGKNCYGYQEEAARMFNKSFQSLNAEETAKLITLAKAPSFYFEHPTEHLKATERLLTQTNLSS